MQNSSNASFQNVVIILPSSSSLASGLGTKMGSDGQQWSSPQWSISFVCTLNFAI